MYSAEYTTVNGLGGLVLTHNIAQEYIAKMTPVTVRLKELRLAKGWTQVELAERAGIRRATVSMLESGKTDSISFNTLDRLARALEVDPGFLVVRRGGKRPS